MPCIMLGMKIRRCFVESTLESLTKNKCSSQNFGSRDSQGESPKTQKKKVSPPVPNDAQPCTKSVQQRELLYLFFSQDDSYAGQS